MEMNALNATENVDGDAMSALTTAKVVAMIVLGGASTVLGLIPLSLRRRRRLRSTPKSGLILSLLLAFGGGALLCTTFLHLLPEVREAVEDLQKDGVMIQTDFHLPELIMCCGFFAMYLVEELVHLYMHSRQRRSLDMAAQEGALERTLSKRKCSKEDLDGSRDTVTTVLPSPPAPQTDIKKVNKIHHSHSHTHVPIPDAVKADDDESSVVSSLRGLLIVLALSVHELFEGLAVGLQPTAAEVYYMMGAVATHKLVLAFCVGVQLVAAKTKTLLIVVYVLTFALVSPIGVSIGLGLGVQMNLAVTGTLQGLASGTLLYVVFFEILQREGTGMRQFCATAIGFGLMFGLLITSK